MSWKSLVCGTAVVAWLVLGCASASYYEGENGRKAVHTSALGQSIAYVCEGASIPGTPVELYVELLQSADLEKVDLEEVLRQIAFSPLPQGTGLCVVAKGGPIDEEIQGVLRVWLWTVGIDAVGDVLSEIIDTVE
jgi:hypothetical protein